MGIHRQTDYEPPSDGRYHPPLGISRLTDTYPRRDQRFSLGDLPLIGITIAIIAGGIHQTYMAENPDTNVAAQNHPAATVEHKSVPAKNPAPAAVSSADLRARMSGQATHPRHNLPSSGISPRSKTSSAPFGTQARYGR